MQKNLINLKVILFPLLTVVVDIVLIVGVGNFLLGRINSLRTEMSGIKTDNDILSERLSTLRSVEAQITDGVAVVTLAMPAESPAVLAANTLRKLSSERSIEITKLTIATAEETTDAVVPVDPAVEATSATLSSNITIEVGVESYEELSDLVRAISNSKPLMSLQSIKTKDEAGGSISAEMTLLAYYSPFPTALPALNEAISGLTSTEEDLLLTLSGFTSPDIAADAGTPVAVPPRDNPFSLDI